MLFQSTKSDQKKSEGKLSGIPKLYVQTRKEKYEQLDRKTRIPMYGSKVSNQHSNMARSLVTAHVLMIMEKHAHRHSLPKQCLMSIALTDNRYCQSLKSNKLITIQDNLKTRWIYSTWNCITHASRKVTHFIAHSKSQDMVMLFFNKLVFALHEW